MPEPRCDVCEAPVDLTRSRGLTPEFVDGEYLADPGVWTRHLDCEHPSRVGFGPIAARAALDAAQPACATHARPSGER